MHPYAQESFVVYIQIVRTSSLFTGFDAAFQPQSVIPTLLSWCGKNFPSNEETITTANIYFVDLQLKINIKIFRNLNIALLHQVYNGIISWNIKYSIIYRYTHTSMCFNFRFTKFLNIPCKCIHIYENEQIKPYSHSSNNCIIKYNTYNLYMYNKILYIPI